MTKRSRDVIAGVDTHGRTHHAAVIDLQGRRLADAEFTACSDGYRRLLAWVRRHGRLHAVGVEGTGTYGAGPTRHAARPPSGTAGAGARPSQARDWRRRSP